MLRSILCGPKIPTDIDDVAKKFAITRFWEEKTIDLERKPLMSGVEDGGYKTAVYAFVVPGTQNVECFLVITKVPQGYHWEASRAGGAEMTVYYQGTEVARMAMYSNIGYFGGVV